jgi:hypothetical protein
MFKKVLSMAELWLLQLLENVEKLNLAHLNFKQTNFLLNLGFYYTP